MIVNCRVNVGLLSTECLPRGFYTLEISWLKRFQSRRACFRCRGHHTPAHGVRALFSGLRQVHEVGGAYLDLRNRADFACGMGTFIIRMGLCLLMDRAPVIIGMGLPLYVKRALFIWGMKVCFFLGGGGGQDRHLSLEGWSWNCLWKGCPSQERGTLLLVKRAPFIWEKGLHFSKIHKGAIWSRGDSGRASSYYLVHKKKPHVI